MAQTCASVHTCLHTHPRAGRRRQQTGPLTEATLEAGFRAALRPALPFESGDGSRNESCFLNELLCVPFGYTATLTCGARACLFTLRLGWPLSGPQSTGRSALSRERPCLACRPRRAPRGTPSSNQWAWPSGAGEHLVEWGELQPGTRGPVSGSRDPTEVAVVLPKCAQHCPSVCLWPAQWLVPRTSESARWEERVAQAPGGIAGPETEGRTVHLCPATPRPRLWGRRQTVGREDGQSAGS